MSNLIKEINQRYLLGERNFHGQNWSKVNLQGINLSGVNLKDSDLSFIDLENANLENANLTKCNLKGANLKGANLKGAILDESDLSFSKLHQAKLNNVHGKKVNFRQAHLNNANLEKAYLSCANFTQASLNNCNLSHSNMRKSDLKNAFLTGANLTQTYLGESNIMGTCFTSTILNKTYFKEAQYDQNTQFDSKLNLQEMGLIYIEFTGVVLTDVLNTINYISSCSQKYLGASLVTKYWHSSKPNNEWLNKFQINNEGRVIYLGRDKVLLNDFQIQWYHQWVREYFKSCSFIISNFSQLIQTDLSSSPYQLHLPLAA
jgi:uncharacterized protein YjbI with pentapeptide repeats